MPWAVPWVVPWVPEKHERSAIRALVSSGTHDVLLLLLLRTDHIQLISKTLLCDRDRISSAAVPVMTLSHLFQLGPR